MRWILASWVLATLWGAGAPLHAQVVAQQRPDAGQIFEQLKERPPIPLRDSTVLPRGPDPKPALGAPGLRVTVKGFRITGNTIYSEEELLSAVTEFTGKELDIDGLNDAATKVRAYYRSRGYFLAQSYLPRQEIRDGVVEIAVIEGRIGKVELGRPKEGRLSDSLLRSILEAHLKEGDIITEKSLETPLLLINDLPNAQVTSEIRPSATIGSADFRVIVNESPGVLSGYADIDNGGSRFTGQNRVGTSLSVSNPLQLGDDLSMRAFTTDRAMNFFRFAYVVPVGPYGTRVGVSHTYFHYHLAEDFKDLLAHGWGTVTSIYGFHPLLRTRGANLILQAGYEDKTFDDSADGASFPFHQHRQITTFKLGGTGDWRDGVFGGGLNAFTATWTEGKLALSPANELAADQAATIGRRTNGRFQKQNYEFRRLQRITENTSFLFQLSGQKAGKNLASAEKFSLGGPNGVRAYPTGEGVADSGHLMSLELRYIVPGYKLWGGDLTLSGFYDMGWAQINKDTLPGDGPNERNLAGYGVGASLGKDNNFVLRASAAWRSENEAPVSDTARRVPRVWVQGIKWF